MIHMGDTRRAIVLAALMVASVVAGGIAVGTGPAAAQTAGTADIVVDESLDTTNATHKQTVAGALADAEAGDTIHIANGTYSPSSQLSIPATGITLDGESRAGVVIDVSNVDGWGLYASQKDDLTFRDFTVLGGGDEAIKVAFQHDVTIQNVVVKGAAGNEIDLNNVRNATLENVVADGEGTSGVGVALSAVENVTLADVHTAGNNWGGVGLFDASDGVQTDHPEGWDLIVSPDEVTVDEESQFENGLYSDMEYGGTVGNLSLAGYDYAVENPTFRSRGEDFVFYHRTFEGATDHAFGLATPENSTIRELSTDDEGYTVTTDTFHVLSRDGTAMSVQGAIDASGEGGVVNVYPGTYETAAYDRGTNDAYKFGLYVPTDNLTIRGVDADGAPVDSRSDIEAELISQESSMFGTNGFYVAGDGVTFQGLEFTPNPDASPNKNIEVSGDDFTLTDSRVNGNIGSVYFNTGNVQVLSVTDNYLNGSLSFNNGVGNESSAENRVVSDNSIGLVSLAGNDTDVDWFNYATGPVTFEDNVVRGHSYTMEYQASGETKTYTYQGVFTLHGTTTESIDIERIVEENTFRRGAYVSNDSSPTGLEDVGDDTADTYVITYDIQEAVDAASAGDTVEVLPGTYTESVSINKSLTLEGAGPGETVIAPESGDAISVDGHTADGGYVEDVTVRDVGLDPASGSMGLIALSETHSDDYDTRNLVVENVAVDGTDALGIGLMSVDGATLRKVTVENVSSESVGALELVGVTDLSIEQSTIRNNTVGLNVFSVDGYGANGPVTTSETTFADNDVHVRDQADVVEPVTQFEFTRTMPGDGKTAYAIGFPGPVEGTVGDVFNDFDGTVWAFDADDQSWTQPDADTDLDSLDALVVIPDEGETARAVVRYESSDKPSPAEADLSAGWNFVAAPQYGTPEDALAASTADPVRVVDTFENPAEVPDDAFQMHTLGTGDAPLLTPYTGYWVYTTEDGTLGANVPAGVTASEYPGYINASAAS